MLLVSTPPTNQQPRIARIWRGRTARSRADETECVTISWWSSVEAMSAFTGIDPMQVHHLPRDPEFLLELPERVQVLHIVDGAMCSTAA